MLAVFAAICQLDFPELAVPFSLFSCLFQFAIPLGLDLFGPPFQFILRSNVADAAVQADRKGSKTCRTR